MDTKEDIRTRQDIEQLLRLFYSKAVLDPTLGIIFTEIVPMNWEHHIPLITDFWESILLDNPVYKKNAMEVHYRLNKIYPLEKKHFDAWLSLFYSSLDSCFTGPKATLAKKRAKDIATLMQYKMNDKQTLL